MLSIFTHVRAAPRRVRGTRGGFARTPDTVHSRRRLRANASNSHGDPADAPEKLTTDQIAEHLRVRPEWSETGEAIQRTYAFKNFAESMKFVAKVAEAAEAANHHPDILIRYNKVTLTLSTHDSGGITAKDFELAGKADGFAAPLLQAKK